MPIFNDLYYSTPGSSYVKKPIQDFVNAGQALNQTWETNKQKHDILELAKANAKARNSVLGKQQADLYDEAFNEFKPYIENNDYENANGVADKVARKLGSNPILKAIQEDNANWQNFVSTNQERLAKGEISADDLKDRIYINDKLHQGKIQYDPVTGEVKNQFKGDLIPKAVNYRKMFDDIYKDLKASNLPPDRAAQIQGYKANATAKGISADDLEAIAQNAIMADPDALEYLKFQVGNEVTLNRLQDNGTLRNYDKSDLIKADVLNPDGSIKIKDNPDTKDIDEAADLYNKIFNEDGTVNQKEANNIYTNKVVNSKLDAVKQYAGSKAWKEQDVKYLDDKQFDLYIKKQELDYEDGLTRKREEDAQTNIYLRPYNLDLGQSTTIDVKNSELFVGKEKDMSMAEIPLSESLRNSLGQENPVVYQNFEVIKEKQKEIEEARKLIVGIKDFKKDKTSTFGRQMIELVSKVDPTFKASQNWDIEKQVNKAMSKIKDNKKEIDLAMLEIKKSDEKYKDVNIEYNNSVKAANDYKPKANLTDEQKSELDNVIKIQKVLKNKVKPVKLASLDGGNNVHKNENGMTSFDVEFDLGNTLDASGLEPDQIQYLTENNILYKDEREVVDDEGKIKKPATYKYRTALKVPPTIESGVMFNKELGNKETPQHLNSSLQKANAKNEYQIYISKNPQLGNLNTNTPTPNGEDMTVNDLIKQLPYLSDDGFAAATYRLSQVINQK